MMNGPQEEIRDVTTHVTFPPSLDLKDYDTVLIFSMETAVITLIIWKTWGKPLGGTLTYAIIKNWLKCEI